MAKSVKTETTFAPEVISERVKEFAETGMQRAKDGYEQFVKTAQSANENARKRAAKASLTMLDVAKEDSDAAFALARDLIAAKSISEAFNIHMAYLKGRYETRVSQAQELGAYVKEASEEAIQPMRDGFAKIMPTAKKAA